MSNRKGYTVEDYRRAVEVHGSQRKAAEALGINTRTLTRALAQSQDPAIEAAMQAVNTGMVPALAWAKTKPDESGMAYSVLLKPQPVADDFLDRVRAAFEDMPEARPVAPPEQVANDLCNVIPLFDVHFGMHAWGKETGGPDYDIQHAESDIRHAFEKVLRFVPDADQAVLIIGGDFFHADDNRSETPGNRHKLDTDGRHHKVLDRAIWALCYVIGRIQSKHRAVHIRVLRGNHDEHSHMVLKFALAAHYRKDGRVTVDMSPIDLLMFQWGRCAIFAHHGDKAPPERLSLYVSDICPFWSATRHRHFYTGHIHKDTARDIGPVRWESLRAFAPPDSYAAGMGYSGRRALRVDTYDKRDGRVMIVSDPIERHADD
jgi:hypothetical protein